MPLLHSRQSSGSIAFKSPLKIVSFVYPHFHDVKFLYLVNSPLLYIVGGEFQLQVHHDRQEPNRCLVYYQYCHTSSMYSTRDYLRSIAVLYPVSIQAILGG